MTSNRFFIQKAKLHQSPVLLTGEEHHNLHSVVRMKPGDNVWLFDEKGNEYLARVEYTGRDNTRLSVMEKIQKKEPPVKITLAQSLIKTSRMEFLLQKSKELGADRFLPVISSRSVVKIDRKIEKKLERWSRIVREVLGEDEDGLNIFLNERDGTYLKEILQEEHDSVKQGMGIPSSFRVLIGPEGGWTEQEERDILEHGFKAISLGPQTLRTESAAISCLVLINHFWNL